MVELFANSEDPDRTPHSAASDLGLHYLPITLSGVSRLQWVKAKFGDINLSMFILKLANNILVIFYTENVTITAYEESQLGWHSRFLICSVFFVSKGNLFDRYFTTLQLVLVPCGGGRTSPHTSP